MHALDIALLLAFAAYAIGSGLRHRRRASRNLEEYFLAGRSLPGWQAGLSMAATQFAADTPLLVTGIIAVSGIFALWQLWIYALLLRRRRSLGRTPKMGRAQPSGHHPKRKFESQGRW